MTKSFHDFGQIQLYKENILVSKNMTIVTYDGRLSLLKIIII